MLHGEPLLETTSIRDLRDDKGGYVADALERTMLLPANVEKLKNMRMQEVFLSAKRHLCVVRLWKPKILLTLVPGLSLTIYLSHLIGSPDHL